MNNEQSPPDKPQDNTPSEWDKLVSGEDDGLTEAERVEVAAVRPVSGNEYPQSLLIKAYREAEENVRKAQEAGDGEMSKYWQAELGKYAKEMTEESLREVHGY